MFNFVLENNNLYRLDAYDLSRDFRKYRAMDFFHDAFGGGCITKTAEATVEATFINRWLQQNMRGLPVAIKEASISLKGNVDLVGYFSECAATAQYTAANGHNQHLLLVLRRRVRSLKDHLYNVHVVDVDLGLPLDSFPRLGNPMVSLTFSNDGKLPFPYPRDASGTSSVFVSSTTYTANSETFVNLTYLDSKVAHYDEISCVIKNKGGLCSRVNKHPTSLLTEKTPAYSYYARVTLVLSSMASAYSVLRRL